MWHEKLILVHPGGDASLVFGTHFFALHQKSCFIVDSKMKTKVTNGPYSYLKTAPFEEPFDAPGRGYNLQH